MAKKKTKIPSDVKKLQARFEFAQAEYTSEFQKAIQEYQSRIGAYETELQGYQKGLQRYESESQAFADYMSSFFIPQGSTTPQTFYSYGGEYYFSDQLRPGYDLRFASQTLPAVSGSEYQFVQTGTQRHSYNYWEDVWKVSGRFEMRPYTAYEYQMKSNFEFVYDPFTGRYENKLVTKNEFVPVTRYRQEWVDTSGFVKEFRPVSQDLGVGYLKTKLPSGGFTSLSPEQFAVRSQPEEFRGKAPTAPEMVDTSGISQKLAEEEIYFKREIGERKSSAVAARRRLGVRPLLSTEGV